LVLADTCNGLEGVFLLVELAIGSFGFISLLVAVIGILGGCDSTVGLEISLSFISLTVSVIELIIDKYKYGCQMLNNSQRAQIFNGHQIVYHRFVSCTVIIFR